MIIPGLIDLHVHASQFAIRGMGMDLELIPWLNKYVFNEEVKYEDKKYAITKYKIFCEALKSSATTRAAVYATLHVPATNILMDMLEESGLITYVGKVNMDQSSPGYLIETTGDSISRTAEWIIDSLARYNNTKPIITPRFAPTCSGELMTSLGKIARRYNTPVQSHLSENREETKWVKDLHPAMDTYCDVYDKHGLLGQVSTIMAHCVYLSERELDLIKASGVYVAHCPQSNINLTSGIAPVREMLDRGIRIGLGSDIAGGFSISIFRAISDAIQVSKLYTVLIDDSQKPLTLSEAFYMATKGGGSFWGKVGSFEPGYAMDAVVIEDEDIDDLDELTLEQRLERIIYLLPDQKLKAKYINGCSVLEE